VSDFEDEVLADLGRYRETEEAVALRACLNLFKRECQPYVEALNASFAEYQTISSLFVGTGADNLITTGPPRAMRISLKLKPNGIRVEE